MDPLRLVAASALAVLLAGGLAPSASAAGGPRSTGGSSSARSATVPAAAIPVVTQALPAAYDPVASYEAQAVCSPSPKPGTRALAGLIKATYGSGQSIGISRACGSGGTSEHKEGRALDWSTSVRSRQGRANAEAFVAWLLGPDQSGIEFGNATRLGVMYIGWNNRFWAAYDTGRGWTELKGCFSTPGSGSDTTCHRNHMHVSLTWDGASGRSSFWDGTAFAPYCASGRSSATVVAGGRAADAVSVPPVRVLSTRAGAGLVTGGGFGGWDGNSGGSDDWSQRAGSRDASGDWFDDDAGDGNWFDDSADGSGDGSDDPGPDASVAPAAPTPVASPATPCRVHPAGWRGDSGGVLTKVTGQGGVPESGVAAVAVRVHAIGSTAPADITVWAPGQQRATTIAHAHMNAGGTGSAIVPVAADGTIALGTSAGATDLTVDVTGYFLAGDQPNTTVAHPGSGG